MINSDSDYWNESIAFNVIKEDTFDSSCSSRDITFKIVDSSSPESRATFKFSSKY